jgi:ketosteroid isomerase-like protein
VTLDQRHALLAKRAWEAASVGDPEALSEVCTDDVTWHASGRGKRGGVYRGQIEVFGYLASIGEEAERFDSQLEDILVGRKFISVLMTVIGVRGEKRLETGYALIFRIEGLKIAEIWSVSRDQAAVDEFWS